MSQESSGTHTDFKEWLYLEADEELSSREQRAFVEHLASCQECRRERREVGRLGELLVESVIPVEDGFCERVLQRLPEAGWEARSFAGWRLALAVLAVLVGASIFLSLGSEGLASEVPMAGAAVALIGLFQSVLVAGGGLLAASWTGIGMALDGLLQGSKAGFAVFGVLVLGLDVLFLRLLLRNRARVGERSAAAESQPRD